MKNQLQILEILFIKAKINVFNSYIEKSNKWCTSNTFPSMYKLFKSYKIAKKYEFYVKFCLSWRWHEMKEIMSLQSAIAINKLLETLLSRLSTWYRCTVPYIKAKKNETETFQKKTFLFFSSIYLFICQIICKIMLYIVHISLCIFLYK